ncbi:hypothetical protein [Saccharibacter floricola]|uniref:hypothetical protein n=1 Tax=Saccharibacter floricola TaxID=231053 RepID=UPI00038029CB|nr:hypothetical protein [Saccharibacter floricola]
MSVQETIRRADSALLDGIFQPIADRLPAGWSSWSVGMSFQLGSLIFQGASIVVPFLFYRVSVNLVVQSVLGFLCSLVLFLGFQRYRTLVRPDMMNPLRPMMRSLRVIGIGFVLYSGWCLVSEPSGDELWNDLDFVSLVIFVIGLYFMACQPRPPKTQNASSWKGAFQRRAAAR